MAQKNWWENLSAERKFGEQFLNDFRNTQHTNAKLLELWPEAVSINGLRVAARFLGEHRNRAEIGRDQKRIANIEKIIEKHLCELIPRGLLSHGMDEAFTKVQGEFKSDLQQASFQFTRQEFLRMIKCCLWKDEKEGSPLRALQDTIRHDMSLDEFSKYHGYIPVELRDEKARELRGMVSAKRSAAFLRGIGRLPIEGSKSIKLPSTSITRPYEISLPAREDGGTETWRGYVINGANIGLPFSPLIEENVVRRALEDAQYTRSNFVVLINLIDIETKKSAGPVRVLRALASGRNIDPAVFDPDYVEEVKKILKDMPDNDMVYELRNEVFEDLMGGWYKITHVPRGEAPEYDGPVLIVIGYKEEQLAAAAAYWHVGYYNKVKQNQIAVERKMALRALAAAQEAENDEAIDECEKLLKVVEKKEARSRITNVDVEWKRFFRKALAYIVQRIETTIPNTKVIGKGTSFAKIAGKVMELNIPSNVRVSDSLLAHRVRSYGQDVLSGRAADLVVVCHPYSLGFRATAREIDYKGHRGKRGLICVAPIAVDDQVIREVTKEVIHRNAHPILKTVVADQFSGGVLQIECVDGVLSASPVDTRALAAHKRKRTSKADRVAGKYIWYLEATDQHHGGRGKEQIWCEEREDFLGMCESAFHLLRRAGYGRESPPPIHLYSANDDPVQGEHFGTHKHPHPHQLHYFEIRDHIALLKEKILRARDPKIRIQLLAKLQVFVLYQIEVRGIDWVSNQLVEIYSRHLEPNADMYSGILQRAMRAGIKLRGISDIIGRPEIPRDGRDLGFINWGSGNHFIKTTDGHLTEGGIYAINLQLLLRAFPEWAGKEKFLKRCITAPLYSSRAIAMGTIQAPGGYEWGVDIRDTVPSMQGWMDPLRGAVRNEQERGNYGRYMEDKVSIRTYGDKHFYAAARTQSSIHMMGPAGTHTDEYGERGFPPNNTGVVFVGLPAEGPEAGPILQRPLLYQDLARLMKRKEPFDWESFLPNPL